MKYRLLYTKEYLEWFNDQNAQERLQIARRLKYIVMHNYFGEIKIIDDDIFELKWANGRRIYFAVITKNNLLLLYGGNKNGQKKDINKAKRLCLKARENAK